MNTMVSAESPQILLTFDVEDWFQVENFKSRIPFSTWNDCQLRVEKNTRLLLALLDDAPARPRATFFILGWIAKKIPGLVREIAEMGHEVASHGFGHDICSRLGPKEMRQDLLRSKSLLEDITGSPVLGYRAPNFSITPRVLDLVREAGYGYDSSYNSFSSHGRYGRLNLSGCPRQGACVEIATGFYEVPVSNLRIRNRILPLGGGGYFRLFPSTLFRQGIRAVLNQEHAFVFYAHPWEFDPDQPRVTNVPAWLRFRHYVNLHRTAGKMGAMIQTFSHCRFPTVSAYVHRVCL